MTLDLLVRLRVEAKIPIRLPNSLPDRTSTSGCLSNFPVMHTAALSKAVRTLRFGSASCPAAFARSRWPVPIDHFAESR